jgi:hypothetical protein
LHFFKPIHLHAQPPDLLVEPDDQLLVVVVGRLGRLEQLWQMIANEAFPLRYLHRLDLISRALCPSALMPIKASSLLMVLKAAVSRLR